jgi:hypothetical protein
MGTDELISPAHVVRPMMLNDRTAIRPASQPRLFTKVTIGPLRRIFTTATDGLSALYEAKLHGSIETNGRVRRQFAVSRRTFRKDTPAEFRRKLKF